MNKEEHIRILSDLKLPVKDIEFTVITINVPESDILEIMTPAFQEELELLGGPGVHICFNGDAIYSVCLLPSFKKLYHKVTYKLIKRIRDTFGKYSVWSDYAL